MAICEVDEEENLTERKQINEKSTDTLNYETAFKVKTAIRRQLGRKSLLDK